MKFVSIIFIHYAMNEARSKVMRSSLESLKNSTKVPYELIVVDNGQSIEDSKFLLEKCQKGEINTYVRNANNMHFAFARNQALRIANGDYFAIVDNDIIYNEGWLEECLEVLDQYPDEKIYATPVYNVAHWRPKYWANRVLMAKDRIYRLNRRAGSNCFVIRRKDMEIIGDFFIHRIAGTKWTDRAWGDLGYMAAVTQDVMVNDLGFRRGYNLNAYPEVKLNLHHGEVYFNEDEFKVKNPDLDYVKQKTWIKE